MSSTPAPTRFDRTGARLLDVKPDAAHNRTVFTFAGAADVVRAGCPRAVRCRGSRASTCGSIHGEHPRIGAVDVVPFVPIEGATMADCVALARTVAQRGLGRATTCRSSCTKKPRVARRAATSRTSAAASSRAWRPSCSSPTGRPTSGRRRRTRRPARRSSARACRSSPTTSTSRPTASTSRKRSRRPCARAPAACASSRPWASNLPTAASCRCR